MYSRRASFANGCVREFLFISAIMKKTLITLLAVSGLAAADTLDPFLPPLSNPLEIGNTGYEYEDVMSWKTSIGHDSVSAADMTHNLSGSIGDAILNTGWYWGDADRINPYSSFSIAPGGFEFSANDQLGAFVIATRKLSDFLNEGDTLTSLTIGFSTWSAASVGFTAWVWDGSSATKLTSDTNGDSYTYNNLALGADQTILFLWNSAGEGNLVYSFSSSCEITKAEVPGDAVPEPTTATLSLLALAGLAARRRRR